MAGPLGFGGVAGITDRTAYVLDDISNLATGARYSFPLRLDQAAFTNIVDSKDVEVTVNGVFMRPYVSQITLPWSVDYDNMPGNSGFRIVGTDIVFYTAPARGSFITITKRNQSATVYYRRYPFSATTIGLGD
jgi:hypothetical protein